MQVYSQIHAFTFLMYVFRDSGENAFNIGRIEYLAIHIDRDDIKGVINLVE